MKRQYSFVDFLELEGRPSEPQRLLSYGRPVTYTQRLTGNWPQSTVQS